jgi:hypothetical protein
MPNSIISYDKDLPEIPGRRPWERPTSFLVKDSSAETGWRVDESGRRPSKLLLIQTDLPPTIFSDPSANEGISLFFAL